MRRAASLVLRAVLPTVPPAFPAALLSAVLALPATVASAPPALAETALAETAEARASGRTFRFVDRPLVEARGARMRFVADLIASSPVLLSFTLTGCKVTCLPSDAVMDHVAERIGRDAGVRLVTITLNPLEDTPERLAERFVKDHHPARLYLSGAAFDVFAVLDGLGVSGASDDNHSVQFIAVGRGGATVVPVEGPDPEAVLAAVETIR